MQVAEYSRTIFGLKRNEWLFDDDGWGGAGVVSLGWDAGSLKSFS